MPILYARRSSKLVAQIAGDVFVVAWSVMWALFGGIVQSTVAATAVPVNQGAQAAERLSEDVQTAADQAARVPAIGAELRQPLDAAVQRLDAVIASAHHEVDLIERAALVLGWLTFVIPVLVVVLAWLPRRVRFAREARAAERLLHARPELDLFALRALVTQPVSRLAHLSQDPAAAWRSGDRQVIDALADLELRSCGVRAAPRDSDPPIRR
jgi:hypothetical protein